MLSNVVRPNDKKSLLKETIIRLTCIFAYAIIVALTLKSFVHAGDLFPGGFTGLARLIQRIGLKYFDVQIPFAPLNVLFSAVPAAVSFKLIGKKFTLYSCLAIVLSSVFTDIVPAIPITEDMLLIAVFGGMLYGFACSLCLVARASAGGTDFISIALSERKNVDAWSYMLYANVVMLLFAGAMFGWDKALYSIIFQFTYIQVIKILDPDGGRETLLIVTGRESAGGVCVQIQDTNHTATLVEGVGLYNGTPCVLIYSVVERNQVRMLTRKIHQYDPKAFVNVLHTERVVGHFYRRPRD